MIVRRPTVLLLVSIMSLGASVATDGPARAATTWLFPSTDNSCPQPDGLQACIDKTEPGDTIELTQDPLNSQFGIITHSLTVKPTAGLDPLVGGLEVEDNGSSAAMAVDIEGLSLLSGLPATFTGGTGHSLVIRDVHVRGHDVLARIHRSTEVEGLLKRRIRRFSCWEDGVVNHPSTQPKEHLIDAIFAPPGPP